MRRCENSLSEFESMGGMKDPGWWKPALMICSQLVNMLRVIKSQRSESSRPEMATKRVLQRINPTRKGQVLESRSTTKNPSQLPPRKPLPLQLSQPQVVPRRLSHGNPVPQRIVPRFLNRNRIGIGIITYAIGVERMGIHPETVLIRSLWINSRKRRLPR